MTEKKETPLSLREVDNVPNLTEDEMQQLLSASTPKLWDAACDAIKKARNGQYPPDWYAMVLRSGLMDRISSYWPKPVSR